MAEEQPSLIRKVYFFKIEHFADVKESLPGAFQRIGALDFDDNGRYRLDQPTQIRLVALPDSEEYPLRLCFGKIRRNGLPQIERQGNLETLQIQEDAGLVDISHIMIFDDGFVAAEWNPDGPKLAQLGPYFFEKGRLNNPPNFLVLMERDIVEVVQNLTSVRVLEIDLPPDAAELARQADESFYDAIKATEKLGATKRVSLKLVAEQGTLKLLKLAQSLAQIVRDNPHERERFHGINVSGYDSASKHTRYVDILESKLVSTEEFSRTSGRSRSVDSEDAYRVLQRAYATNREKLIISATSTDWR